jgi:hypothetical protein
LGNVRFASINPNIGEIHHVLKFSLNDAGAGWSLARMKIAGVGIFKILSIHADVGLTALVPCQGAM